MQQLYLGKYVISPYQAFSGNDYIFVGNNGWHDFNYDESFYGEILKRQTKKLQAYNNVSELDEDLFLAEMVRAAASNHVSSQTGEADFPRVYVDVPSYDALLFKLWKTIFTNPDPESLIKLYRITALDFRSKTFMGNHSAVFDYKKFFALTPEEVTQQYEAAIPFKNKETVLSLLPIDYLYLVRRATSDDLGLTETLDEEHEKHLWKFLILVLLDAISEAKMRIPVYPVVYGFDPWGKSIDEIVGAFSTIYGPVNGKFVTDPQFGWVFNELIDFSAYDKTKLFSEIFRLKVEVFKDQYPMRPDIYNNPNSSFFGLVNIVFKENRIPSVDETLNTDHFYKWEYIKNVANFFGGNHTLMQYLCRKDNPKLQLWN